jgi:F-type H+-transporting ATPase subunit epsilon
MKLRVLVPAEVAVERTVAKVVADAENGSFCLRPRHIDFVAVLVPGLLMFEDQDGDETFLAVDRGLLVKCGREVLVSTTRVIRGRPLGELRRAVEEELSSLDERQQRARTALGKIEADFVRRLVELEQRVHG